MVWRQPPLAKRDFFQTSDLLTLALFDRLDVARGLQQGFMGTGMEPGKAAVEQLHLQIAAFEVSLVDGGDFQFTAGRGLYPTGNAHHVVVVEIQAGDCVVTLWLGRFFFDGGHTSFFVEGYYPKALRITDAVAEPGNFTRLAFKNS